MGGPRVGGPGGVLRPPAGIHTLFVRSHSSSVPLPVRACLLLLALLAAAPGCGDGGLGVVRSGFRVAEERLEFGAALEGEEVVRQLTLSNTGRVHVEVRLEVSAPFSAPSQVPLAPGAAVPVEV